jgi:dGTPase
LQRGGYRQRTEQIERDTLSGRAQLVAKSAGRDVAEPSDPIRTLFQQDRDRIIHSKPFRRLAHKTQVFLAPEGDHYRVRLTHTLEVTQVARTIARALGLNEDLVEAICLGHDLGHTPFGHLGEEMVAEFQLGFRHNLQSVRIVEILEPMNLTKEVRDGIANHTWSMAMPATLEGQIARYADRIAYINHDIEDAIRAGILTESDLPQVTRSVLGVGKTRRIAIMVNDIVDASYDKDGILMTDGVMNAMGVTRDFLFERVYLGLVAASTRDAVHRVVERLLEHFSKNGVPDDPSSPDQASEMSAVDYVSGMTDRFAIKTFESVVGVPPPDLTAGLG